MARALRRPLARLFHRTVPASVVRGFGAALVVAGVALPWVVAASGGWETAAEAEPVVPSGHAPDAEPASEAAGSAEPLSGTQVAAATAMRPALVHVTGGTFMMGSPVGEAGRFESETQHRVQVSSFVMCETEVTQAQFTAVAGKLPEGCGSSCGDALPAYSASWFDAVDYLDALSRKEGLRPCYAGREGDAVSWDRSCDGYRLPTEAEWEYASRAGKRTAYSFGDSPAELCKHANGAKQELCDDGFAGLAPVGSFRANRGNAWKLLDMHGNVLEWVWDKYDAGYGLDVSQLTDVNHLTIDPGGPDPFVGARVLRGGSFVNEASYLRSADRNRYEPSYRSRDIGFRCVRTARPQP